MGTRGPAVRLVAPGGPRRWSPGGGARRPGRDLRGPPLVVPGAPWCSLAGLSGAKARFWGPGAGPGGPRGSPEVVPGRRRSEAGQGPPGTPAGGPWWSLEVARPGFRGLAPALGVRGGPRRHHRVRGGETVPTVPGSSARPKGRLNGSLKRLASLGVCYLFFFFRARRGSAGVPERGGPSGDPPGAGPVPRGPPGAELWPFKWLPGGPRGVREAPGGPPVVPRPRPRPPGRPRAARGRPLGSGAPSSRPPGSLPPSFLCKTLPHKVGTPSIAEV